MIKNLLANCAVVTGICTALTITVGLGMTASASALTFSETKMIGSWVYSINFDGEDSNSDGILSHDELLDLTATLSHAPMFTMEETTLWTINDITEFNWVINGSEGTVISLYNDVKTYSGESFYIDDGRILMEIFSNTYSYADTLSYIEGYKQTNSVWNYYEYIEGYYDDMSMGYYDDMSMGYYDDMSMSYYDDMSMGYYDYIYSDSSPEILLGKNGDDPNNTYSDSSPETSAKVPEPSTLLGLGLFGVLGSVITQKKRTSCQSLDKK